MLLHRAVRDRITALGRCFTNGAGVFEMSDKTRRLPPPLTALVNLTEQYANHPTIGALHRELDELGKIDHLEGWKSYSHQTWDHF